MSHISLLVQYQAMPYILHYTCAQIGSNALKLLLDTILCTESWNQVLAFWWPNYKMAFYVWLIVPYFWNMIIYIKQSLEGKTRSFKLDLLYVSLDIPPHDFIAINNGFFSLYDHTRENVSYQRRKSCELSNLTNICLVNISSCYKVSVILPLIEF